MFKCLVAWCHSFCLFFIFYNILTYIHTITFIQDIYPSPFAEASLHFFIACLLSGGTSLWCRAENQTRACLTASRRATNWATPHHFFFFFFWGFRRASSTAFRWADHPRILVGPPVGCSSTLDDPILGCWAGESNPGPPYSSQALCPLDHASPQTGPCLTPTGPCLTPTGPCLTPTGPCLTPIRTVQCVACCLIMMSVQCVACWHCSLF